MPKELCDLHTHTIYSDGELTPKELVDLAIKKKIKHLAITDHDTILGNYEAIKYAKDKDINIISGVEFSVSILSNNMHLVGLYLDPHNKDIINFSKRLTEMKHDKNINRIKTINKYFSSNISYEEIRNRTKGIPNLQHIAQAMLEKNLIKEKREGIYLSLKGGACYFSSPSKNINAKEAIQKIKEAGGIAIFPHPSLYQDKDLFLTEEKQKQLIEKLISYGLDGIEIQSSDSTPENVKLAKNWAKKYNLKMSGGSDFHGDVFPQNVLGGLPLYKEEMTVIK